MVDHHSSPEHELVSDYRLDLSRMIHMLYLDVEQQITRADTKSQLILSTDAILLAILASSTLVPQGSARVDAHPALVTAIVALNLLALALVLTSVIMAMLAAFPRFGKEAQASERASFFHPVQIATRPSHEYVGEFLDLSLQDVKRDVMAQIHAKARIAQRKYRNVQRAMTFTVLAIILWAGLRVIVYLA
jgi:hypothetical protein